MYYTLDEALRRQLAEREAEADRLKYNVERLEKRCATYQRDFKSMFKDTTP